MTKIDMHQIMEEVKENHRKLRTCSRPHEFTIPAPKKGTVRQRVACQKCGGLRTRIEATLYNEGLQDGRAEVFRDACEKKVESAK